MQRKANLKVSRAESLKLNVAFAKKGISPLGVIKIPIGNKRIVRKSLAEAAEEREVTLITAVRMSKERRLSLKKANPVEVVVIHVVAVEGFFVVVGRPTVHNVVADIK